MGEQNLQPDEVRLAEVRARLKGNGLHDWKSVASVTSDIRFLLARLEAVQAERDELLRHAISMASSLDMEGLDDNDAVRYVKRLAEKESDDANAG